MGWGKLFSVILIAVRTHAAIFGSDTRAAVTPASPANQYGRSVAIAVLSALWSESAPGQIDLATDTNRLCTSERFAQAPALAYSCTGFLVGPDLIATAGHCMINVGEDHNETQTYCQVYSWLFDYQTSDSGTTPVKGIAEDKLYHCKQVIYAIREEHAPYRDYALVQLDRSVQGRTPFALSDQPLASNISLSMIGFPLGAPETLSSDGHVLLNDSSRQSFITNLSALEGNSGSPVFDPHGQVVGILIGGTPSQSDFSDPSAGCEHLNVCSLDGSTCALPDTQIFDGFQRTGSEVQRIQPLLDLLKSLVPGA